MITMIQDNSKIDNSILLMAFLKNGKTLVVSIDLQLFNYYNI